MPRLQSVNYFITDLIPNFPSFNHKYSFLNCLHESNTLIHFKYLNENYFKIFLSNYCDDHVPIFLPQIVQNSQRNSAIYLIHLYIFS